jgi:hypothetical protein
VSITVQPDEVSAQAAVEVDTKDHLAGHAEAVCGCRGGSRDRPPHVCPVPRPAKVRGLVLGDNVTLPGQLLFFLRRGRDRRSRGEQLTTVSN